MAKPKKHIVTNMDRLKMMKKVMRETTHKVKPMITTDKKKQKNKLESRKFKQTKNKSHE
jgi:hypothetical protein